MPKFQSKDYTGEKIGRYTVLSVADPPKGVKSKYTYWLCECDCGTKFIRASRHLYDSISCGCAASKAESLIGRRYGRLVVKEDLGRNKYGDHNWLCVCDCGNEKIIMGNSLKRGLTTSCGCFHKEVVSNISKTHGLSKHPLYKIWCDMRHRCKHDMLYAGRGIDVCDEWKDDFTAFYNWSLENGWNEEKQNGRNQISIDRIDNNGPYAPWNRRWTDHVTQMNNVRYNTILELDGKIHTLAEWCRIYDMNYHTVYSRFKRGWDLKRALMTPTHK